MTEGILDTLDYLNSKQIYVKRITGETTNKKREGVKRPKEALELVHTNLCGLFLAALWNVQWYFIIFIDDSFHYDYLYLIHERPQPLDMFETFNAKVKIQLGQKIKSIRSN